MSKERERILKLIREKEIALQGFSFEPYTNRDGSQSWQQKAEEYLSNPDVKQIHVISANSCGKTSYASYVAISVLNGVHDFCKQFDKPIHIHVVCESFDVQKNTFQKIVSEITNYELDPYSYDKDKYVVITHSGRFKEIRNKKTKNMITFSSAQEGQQGLVGIRPELLISDEPLPESAYEELSFRTTAKNSKYLLVCTAVNLRHAYIMINANKHLENPDPSLKILTAKMTDNPYADLGTIDFYKRKFGESSIAYRVRVLGELLLSEGLVLSNIENCIVSKDYIPEVFKSIHQNDLENYYKWFEIHDYGIGETDPTLIGFFKLWDNGEIVQEDEICLYQKSTEDWIDSVIRKRYELGMPYDIDYTGNVKADIKLQIPICRPYKCVGDKQYLARKNRTTRSRLSTDFAKRGVFVKPSLGEKIEVGAPLVQNMFTEEIIKIKENCRFSIQFGKSHIMKTNESTGKTSYASPYDHYFDVLRYLVESLPKNHRFIQEYNINNIFKEKFKENSEGNQLRNRIDKNSRYL